jgi:hypothetical protein
MAKQVHIRLDDAVYEALADYTEETSSSVQDSVSSAIIQFLKRQNRETVPADVDFTFIDLFAGIGGMRLAYDIVYIPMNGINTVSRPILLILVSNRMEILLKWMRAIFLTMMFLLPVFRVSHFP